MSFDSLNRRITISKIGLKNKFSNIIRTKQNAFQGLIARVIKLQHYLLIVDSTKYSYTLALIKQFELKVSQFLRINNFLI